ncbi:AMP-binding, conserved site [Sergentomyia squamirostris]
MMTTKYDSVKKVWSGSTDCSPLFHESVTLGRAALYTLGLYPDKVCQISADDGSSRTNGQIYQSTMKVAINLKIRGCSVGDVVGFVCRNTHNLTPAVLASLFLGAPVNALDAAFLKDEIVHMFRTTGPKFVFCDDNTVRMVQKALMELQSKATIIVLGERVGNFVHIDDFLNDESHQMEIIQLSMNPPEVDRNSCGAIICSSGTTGPAKGVAISHLTLQMTLCRPAMSFLIDTSDMMLSFSSMYWLSGWSSMFMSLFLGIPRVMTVRASSSEAYISVLKEYPVTLVINSPSQVAELVNSPLIEKDTMAKVKCMMCGGGLVTQELADSVKPYLPNGVFVIGYGMTETGGISALFVPTSKVSVGTLTVGVTVKILDEDGKNLGVGESGEIVVKTGVQFLGYYNNPKATAETLDKEGWIHSGDIGHFDEDGFLFITGRRKDMFKYNNYQITPSELEEILEKHPGVVHAVVVGIPDSVHLNLPAAVIVRKNGSTVSAEELTHLVEKNVSDFKKLRGGIYFVNELPMTPSGKIQKLKVLEMAKKFFQETSPSKL